MKKLICCILSLLALQVIAKEEQLCGDFPISPGEPFITTGFPNQFSFTCTALLSANEPLARVRITALSGEGYINGKHLRLGDVEEFNVASGESFDMTAGAYAQVMLEKVAIDASTPNVEQAIAHCCM